MIDWSYTRPTSIHRSTADCKVDDAHSDGFSAFLSFTIRREATYFSAAYSQYGITSTCRLQCIFPKHCWSLYLYSAGANYTSVRLLRNGTVNDDDGGVGSGDGDGGGRAVELQINQCGKVNQLRLTHFNNICIQRTREFMPCLRANE